MKTLHVLTSITNFMNYQSRTRLYHQFAAYMARFDNVTFWTIEGARPGQEFTVTSADNPHHVQVVLNDPLWYKENLLNVLISRLPDDGNPIAWIDADLIFTRPDWPEETIRRLEEHDVVQMFSECQEMTDQFTLVKNNYRLGMIYAWTQGILPPPCYVPYPDIQQAGKYNTQMGHCGYAWAASRVGLAKLGGKLIDFGIVGSGDYQFATALLGDCAASMSPDIHPGYRAGIVALQDRAQANHVSLGYVPGMCLHNWHGKRSDRGFNWRERILVDNQYNPETDLIYDEQGIMHLSDVDSPRLDAIRSGLLGYYASRNEDVPTE